MAVASKTRARLMAGLNPPAKHSQLTYKTVRRPWGNFTVIGTWSDRITVRILTINPRSRISLQKHKFRDEEWLCLRGRARVRIDDRTFVLKEGEKTFVPRNHLHRVGSYLGAEILEVAHGRFRDNDIVRVEDDYGRARSI
jgi:mannose-6-phosphate isomerase-like protein (cupin superfamily)